MNESTGIAKDPIRSLSDKEAKTDWDKKHKEMTNMELNKSIKVEYAGTHKVKKADLYITEKDQERNLLNIEAFITLGNQNITINCPVLRSDLERLGIKEVVNMIVSLREFDANEEAFLHYCERRIDELEFERMG